MRLNQALLAGFVIYLQNPGMSILAVWELGAISAEENAPLIRDCIGQRLFEQSAADMQWHVRREQHWMEVRGRVEAKLLDQHVQRTLADIGNLESLRTVLMQHVRGDAAAGIKPIQPRSLEGAVKAFVDVTKLEVELRGVVVEQAADAAKSTGGPTRTDAQLPGAGAAGALVLDDDGFSDAEIEAMARAAAHKNALGGGRKLIAAPPPPPEVSPTATKSDNETLARPVMEPL